MLHPILTGRIDERQSSGSIVFDDRIDFTTVSAWLYNYEAKHLDICSRKKNVVTAERPPGFRLVDVLDKCVRPTSMDCRYIALSYVWGASPKMAQLQLNVANAVTLERAGSLQDHISKVPQTILDAMEVVKAIGERYIPLS